MLFPLIEENDDLTVFMTESCNSNCVMCPMSRDSRKRGNHCSDEAWAEALACSTSGGIATFPSQAANPF